MLAYPKSTNLLVLFRIAKKNGFLINMEKWLMFTSYLSYRKFIAKAKTDKVVQVKTYAQNAKIQEHFNKTF